MKDRRTLTLSILAIVILCLSVVGLSFAYFSANISNVDSVKVNVETSSNAVIYYNTGEDLILNANQPGYSKEVVFYVKLLGEKENDVNSVYDINLIVDSNNFEYDPNETNNTPELLYSLYMSEDNQSWKEIIVDRDATELTQTINLVDAQKISANAGDETTQYWKVVFSYISLDKDQSYNMNKSFYGSIKVENVE